MFLSFWLVLLVLLRFKVRYTHACHLNHLLWTFFFFQNIQSCTIQTLKNNQNQSLYDNIATSLGSNSGVWVERCPPTEAAFASTTTLCLLSTIKPLLEFIQYTWLPSSAGRVEIRIDKDESLAATLPLHQPRGLETVTAPSELCKWQSLTPALTLFARSSFDREC